MTPAEFIAHHYRSDARPGWAGANFIVQHIGWLKRAVAIWHRHESSLLKWGQLRKNHPKVAGIPQIHTVISVGVDLPGVDHIAADVVDENGKPWAGLVEIEWVTPLLDVRPNGSRWQPMMPVQVAQRFWELATQVGIEPVDPWEWAGWAKTGRQELVLVGELR